MAEFFSGMKDDFIQSFVEGDRWLLYLKGIGVTLQVAAMALVLGIVLGVLVAVVRTSHDQQRPGKHNPVLGVLNVICQIYTTVIRGTPIMVQLLIMYFVIFASTRNQVGVAMLTFGVNSGAYVSEIIRGGIMSIAISGSPPKKSTSILCRLPDFFATHSIARMATSGGMIFRPVPKSPVDAKQYLHLRLQSWDTWRHRAFTGASLGTASAGST